MLSIYCCDHIIIFTYIKLLWYTPEINILYANCMCAKSLQPCPTLCYRMDCSSPGSSVHGNSPSKNRVGCHAIPLQGIVLPRYPTHFSYVSCIGRRVFLPVAPPEKSLYVKWISVKIKQKPLLYNKSVEVILWKICNDENFKI